MTKLTSAMKISGHNFRGDREKNDFYATPSQATEKLLQVEQFDGKIYEPCCGQLLIQFLNHTQLIADKKICLLLKLQALEGIARGEFYKTFPPVRVHVFSKRVSLMKNGDSYDGGMMALAWFVWEKGNKDKPIVSWL